MQPSGDRIDDASVSPAERRNQPDAAPVWIKSQSCRTCRRLPLTQRPRFGEGDRNGRAVVWERSGFNVEGERLRLHQFGDNVDRFSLVNDIAHPTSVVLEQRDGGPSVLIRNPRQAEGLKLGQKLGRTGVIGDERIAVAIDRRARSEQLAKRTGDRD